jgi:hypothetical protein
MFILLYLNLAKLRRLPEGMLSGALHNFIFMKITIQTVNSQLHRERESMLNRKLPTCTIKVYCREEAQLNAFFTSAPDVEEW